MATRSVVSCNIAARKGCQNRSAGAPQNIRSACKEEPEKQAIHGLFGRCEFDGGHPVCIRHCSGG
jgi:hypothetical protein